VLTREKVLCARIKDGLTTLDITTHLLTTTTIN
jgi:hypothetical protein